MNNQKRINELASEIYKNEFKDNVENVRGLAKDIIKWLEEQNGQGGRNARISIKQRF